MFANIDIVEIPSAITTSEFSSVKKSCHLSNFYVDAGNILMG